MRQPTLFPMPDDDSDAQQNQGQEPADTNESLNKIRLGCTDCDRDDFDGVESLPPDWIDVMYQQTWEDSIRPINETSPLSDSVFEWQTHLGLCPDCQLEE